ncbi:DUF7133 domain-containing protein [Rubritalea marina]|uniref:DUF7133 domain-containing protein n=1 Tax=Rubritalea marina TaxID=361055 RepID=UPI00035FBD08|nr:hypothetical protein [Rubritalea marina]
MNPRLILKLLTILGVLHSQVLAQFTWTQHYKVEDIPAPKGVDYQIGGLAMTPQGKLIACFHRGEVMVYSERDQSWSLFASGLHEPLGIYVEDKGTVLVIQRGELTRLHDTNKDGKADLYENVCNDWGLSGNYHEFTFGLVKDSKKNIYIALGTASNGSGVREHIRGPWNDTGGLTHDMFLYKDGKEWNEKKKHVPRMYARVPYRGCVLKITPGNKKAEVYATGLRTPNGLYIDHSDQLWISDNQGDWVGASKMHRIKEGGFHGHVASLLWSESPPERVPARLPVKELQAMRIKAPILLPQGECGNSITQPLESRPSFFPHRDTALSKDQIIMGEMNHARLVRYLPDTVNGTHQGTAIHTLNTQAIEMGNNRLLYSKDGKSLYLGKTHLSWPGREGIRKVTYTGKPYLMVESVKLTDSGFLITFNHDITLASQSPKPSIESYTIAYHAHYGSPKINRQKHTAKITTMANNQVLLTLDQAMMANRVYDITLPNAIQASCGELSSKRFWYTAHVLP